MIDDLKEIEDSALKLSKKQKAHLADKLLQSIHGEIDPEIEKAWVEEIKRRKKSLESGEASLHSAADVLKEARKRIQE